MPAVRRIIVGVHGSLGSLQALRFAADEARLRDVPLLPVLAWVPPGGDLAERRHSSPYLRKVWRDDAWRRLCAAFPVDAQPAAKAIGMYCTPAIRHGGRTPWAASSATIRV